MALAFTFGDFPLLSITALFRDRAPFFSLACAVFVVPFEPVVAAAILGTLSLGNALPLVVVPLFVCGAHTCRVKVYLAFTGAGLKTHGLDTAALLANRAFVFGGTPRVFVLPFARSDCWL